MSDEQVSAQDPSLRNSPSADTTEAAVADDAFQAGMLGAEDAVCYWNDKKYSDGATVCDSGQRHKCWSGKWVDIGNC